MELTVMETREINKKNKKKKGFTLIEMVVVMAIIAILAGFAIPQVMKSITKSKVTVDIGSARAIGMGITQGIAEGKSIKEVDVWTEITKDKDKDKMDWLDDYVQDMGKLEIKKADGYHWFYKYKSSDNTLEIGAGNDKNAPQELYPVPSSKY